MARDKRATRSLMQAAGLPSPKHCLINCELTCYYSLFQHS
jgi:hypothetical protein